MNIYYVELYDYYNKLLTDKQKEYFVDYYFNNLTLQEIADNNGVSKNAIHKNIKEILKKLDNYESSLNLLKNRKEIEKIIKDLDDDIKLKIEELI